MGNQTPPACAPDNYHPYECSNDRSCKHCTNADIKGHDPGNCALCCEGNPETEEPIRFVDEEYDPEYNKQTMTDGITLDSYLEPNKELLKEIFGEQNYYIDQNLCTSCEHCQKGVEQLRKSHQQQAKALRKVKEIADNMEESDNCRINKVGEGIIKEMEDILLGTERKT